MIVKVFEMIKRTHLIKVPFAAKKLNGGCYGKSYLLNTLFYKHLKIENIAEGYIIKFASYQADINDFLVLLGANGQGIGHQVVNEAGLPWVKLCAAARAAGCAFFKDAPQKRDIRSSLIRQNTKPFLLELFP